MQKGKLTSYHFTLKNRIKQLRDLHSTISHPSDMDLTSSSGGHLDDNDGSPKTKKSPGRSPKVANNNKAKKASNEDLHHQSQINNNYLYRKLQTTVKLLNESLEEQGNLRALLELTSNPAVYNSILQSEIFHLAQQADAIEAIDPDLYDELLPVSNDLEIHVKHRALLLEQQQLCSQLIDLRTDYEGEKLRNAQLDTELNVTKDLLETAQKEIDQLHKKVDHLNQQFLSSTQNNRRNSASSVNSSSMLTRTGSLEDTSMTFTAPGSAFPPRPTSANSTSKSKGPAKTSKYRLEDLENELGRDMRAPVDDSDVEENLLDALDEDVPPPGPEYHQHYSPAEEEDEHSPVDDIDDDYLNDDERIEGTVKPSKKHPNNKNHKTSAQKKNAPVKSSNTHAQQSYYSEHSEGYDDGEGSSAISPVTVEDGLEEDTTAVAASAQEPAEQDPDNAYLVLNIDLETNDESTGQIVITGESNPMMLALEFIEGHQLNESYFGPLFEYIKSHQDQLIQNQLEQTRRLQEQQEAEAVASPEVLPVPTTAPTTTAVAKTTTKSPGATKTTAKQTTTPTSTTTSTPTSTTSSHRTPSKSSSSADRKTKTDTTTAAASVITATATALDYDEYMNEDTPEKLQLTELSASPAGSEYRHDPTTNNNSAMKQPSSVSSSPLLMESIARDDTYGHHQYPPASSYYPRHTASSPMQYEISPDRTVDQANPYHEHHGEQYEYDNEYNEYEEYEHPNEGEHFAHRHFAHGEDHDEYDEQAGQEGKGYEHDMNDDQGYGYPPEGDYEEYEDYYPAQHQQQQQYYPQDDQGDDQGDAHLEDYADDDDNAFPHQTHHQTHHQQHQQHHQTYQQHEEEHYEDAQPQGQEELQTYEYADNNDEYDDNNEDDRVHYSAFQESSLLPNQLFATNTSEVPYNDKTLWDIPQEEEMEYNRTIIAPSQPHQIQQQQLQGQPKKPYEYRFSLLQDEEEEDEKDDPETETNSTAYDETLLDSLFGMTNSPRSTITSVVTTLTVGSSKASKASKTSKTVNSVKTKNNTIHPPIISTPTTTITSTSTTPKQNTAQHTAHHTVVQHTVVQPTVVQPTVVVQHTSPRPQHHPRQTHQEVDQEEEQEEEDAEEEEEEIDMIIAQEEEEAPQPVIPVLPVILSKPFTANKPLVRASIALGTTTHMQHHTNNTNNNNKTNNNNNNTNNNQKNKSDVIQYQQPIPVPPVVVAPVVVPVVASPVSVTNNHKSTTQPSPQPQTQTQQPQIPKVVSRRASAPPININNPNTTSTTVKVEEGSGGSGDMSNTMSNTMSKTMSKTMSIAFTPAIIPEVQQRRKSEIAAVSSSLSSLFGSLDNTDDDVQHPDKHDQHLDKHDQHLDKLDQPLDKHVQDPDIGATSIRSQQPFQPPHKLPPPPVTTTTTTSAVVAPVNTTTTTTTVRMSPNNNNINVSTLSSGEIGEVDESMDWHAYELSQLLEQYQQQSTQPQKQQNHSLLLQQQMVFTKPSVPVTVPVSSSVVVPVIPPVIPVTPPVIPVIPPVIPVLPGRRASLSDMSNHGTYTSKQYAAILPRRPSISTTTTIHSSPPPNHTISSPITGMSETVLGHIQQPGMTHGSMTTHPITGNTNTGNTHTGNTTTTTNTGTVTGTGSYPSLQQQLLLPPPNPLVTSPTGTTTTTTGNTGENKPVRRASMSTAPTTTTTSAMTATTSTTVGETVPAATYTSKQYAAIIPRRPSMTTVLPTTSTTTSTGVMSSPKTSSDIIGHSSAVSSPLAGNIGNSVHAPTANMKPTRRHSVTTSMTPPTSTSSTSATVTVPGNSNNGSAGVVPPSRRQSRHFDML